MSDKETLRVYAAKTAEYAALSGGTNTKDPQLDAFMAALPVEGNVLDLGCGPGAAAAVMAQAGLKVHAVDAVPEMVALAAKHPSVRAQVATFDDIKGTDVYDGIWANFSLLHAERDALPRILTALHAALRSGGRFHIAMKLGADAKRDAIGRKYTYVSEAELHGLLADVGFIVTTQASGREKGLDGTYADWIALGAYG